MATVVEFSRQSEVAELSSEYRVASPVIGFERARELVAEYGSPLLVFSHAQVRRNFEAMRSALPGVEFFYAAKSNPCYPILSTLAEAGCSVDVCSWGEMKSALEAGFTPDRMIHTHPCKTVSNLLDCYKAGLRWFTIDNKCEAEKIAAHTPDVNILCRLAMSSQSSAINLSAKFGCSEQDAVGIMLHAKSQGLAVKGISFHVGSQCRSPDDFHVALMRARRVWDRAVDAGIPLEVLDFGGGIPAPYRHDAVLTLDAYCQSLSQALEATFGDLNIRIIAEPGRGMSADTGTLVTSVLGKSVRSGLTWYIIDEGVYGSFSGQVYDHVEFPLLAENADERAVSPCVVAGPTCDSSDVVCRDQQLPDLDVGELLLVPTMGSYTNASACPFNGLPVARIIGVD
jgi:ornithine decarboxylase